MVQTIDYHKTNHHELNHEVDCRRYYDPNIRIPQSARTQNLDQCSSLQHLENVGALKDDWSVSNPVEVFDLVAPTVYQLETTWFHPIVRLHVLQCNL